MATAFMDNQGVVSSDARRVLECSSNLSALRTREIGRCTNFEMSWVHGFSQFNLPGNPSEVNQANTKLPVRPDRIRIPKVFESLRVAPDFGPPSEDEFDENSCVRR